MDRTHLKQHLEFAAELGVAGISRDPAWRRRPVDPEASAPAPASAPLTFSKTAADALVAVRTEIGDCTRCKLHAEGRKQIVFGVGNPEADLMFVGEAPGADEDAQGIPSRPGEIRLHVVRDLLRHVAARECGNGKRATFRYVADEVPTRDHHWAKAFPIAPGRDEDIQGIPFVGRAGQKLTQIIEAIGLTREDVYIANVIKCRPPGNRNPEQDEVDTWEPFLFQQIDIIKPKAIVALGTFAARALLRTLDPISRLRGRVYDYRGAKLIPTFHPAYLLRNPASKREVWEDMKVVRTLLTQ